MNSQNNEKSRKIDIVFDVICYVMGILLFVIYHGNEYILQKDSYTYINLPYTLSVMPIYPLILAIAHKLCGEVYLYAIIYFQGMLALACTICFKSYVCKTYKLQGIERLIVYVATLLPMSIYLPEYVVTKQILTEGITYSLIYIYVLLLVRALNELSWKMIVSSFLMGIILHLCRTQFIYLNVITAIITLIVIYRSRLNKKNKFVISIIAFVASILSVVIVYKTANIVVKNIYPLVDMSEEIITEESSNNGRVVRIINEDSDESYSGSQFAEIIILRGFYLARSEDSRYFDNPDIRQAFNEIYRLAVEDECLLSNSRPTLGNWQEMFNEQITRDAYIALKDYYQKQGLTGSALWTTIHSTFVKIGITLILRHFPTFVGCCLRLFGAGMMACLFYQKKSIYILCVITTILLTILGIVFLVCNKKWKRDNEYNLLLVCSIVIVISVGIISIVFYPLQRYLVYYQGVYYIALFMFIRNTSVYRSIMRKNIDINE